MKENKAIICSSCSERNNPSFNQCWKCGHWFVTPPLNMPEPPPKRTINRTALTSGLLLSFLGSPFLFWLANKLPFIAKPIPYIGLGILVLVAFSPLLVSTEDKESAYDFLNGFFIGIGVLILTLISLCFGAICFSSLFK